MASVNIWREIVVYDVLTINERQKRDPEFGELLNEVQVNCISDKSVVQLRKLLHIRLVHCYWSMMLGL